MRQVAGRLRLIFPFYNEEVHLFAGKSILSFGDLQGKRVVVGEYIVVAVRRCRWLSNGRKWWAWRVQYIVCGTHGWIRHSWRHRSRLFVLFWTGHFRGGSSLLQWIRRWRRRRLLGRRQFLLYGWWRRLQLRRQRRNSSQPHHRRKHWIWQCNADVHYP